MKKFLVISGVLFGLFNPVLAADSQKYQVISEIGALANNKNYLQALDKCMEALKKYPDEAELYYWSAVVKTKIGDINSAITDFNKAIELNPDNSSIYVMRGVAKSDLGDNKGAIEDFDTALKINPKDVSAYMMRACVKIEMGDMQGADADFNASNKLLETIK